MKIKTPTLEDIALIAQQFGLSLSDDDLLSFQGLMAGPIASYERIDDIVEPKPPVMYPRAGVWRPEPADNPLNAWYYRCSIKGAKAGKLKGRLGSYSRKNCRRSPLPNPHMERDR